MMCRDARRRRAEPMRWGCGPRPGRGTLHRRHLSRESAHRVDRMGKLMQAT